MGVTGGKGGADAVAKREGDKLGWDFRGVGCREEFLEGEGGKEGRSRADREREQGDKWASKEDS